MKRVFIIFMSLLILFSYSCTKTSNVDEKETELLEKENDLLKKENEFLKKQNEIEASKEISAEDGSSSKKVDESFEVKSNLEYLYDMKGKYPNDVGLLEQAEMSERIIDLIGERFSFVKNNWNVESPIKVTDEYFVPFPCQAHNCPSTNFIIVVDLVSDYLSIGIREEGDIETYYEDERGKPEPISNWEKNY